MLTLTLYPLHPPVSFQEPVFYPPSLLDVPGGKAFSVNSIPPLFIHRNVKRVQEKIRNLLWDTKHLKWERWQEKRGNYKIAFRQLSLLDHRNDSERAKGENGSPLMAALGWGRLGCQQRAGMSLSDLQQTKEVRTGSGEDWWPIGYPEIATLLSLYSPVS